MKRLFFRLTAFLMMVAYVNSLKAQQSVGKINVVTTAVPFLRISPDARAGGMGELGVATSPDASSTFYNLAKIPFSEYNTGIGFTYTPWLKDLGLNDVYLLAGSGYHKLDDNQALSASIRYFSLGNIQFTDYSGNNISNGRPREFGADLGYTRKLSQKIAVGLTLRYINSNLTSGFPTSSGTTKPGNAIAADLSIFYNGRDDKGKGWNFGAAFTNLGTKIGYTNDATQKEFIPANLGIGAAYTFVFDEQNKLTFGLDINKLLVPTAPTPTDPTDEQQDSLNLANYHDMSVVSSWFKSFGNGAYNASIGAEYGYNDQFFFRTGYFYEPTDQGGRQYFTLGVGIKYNVVGLNFSYLIPSGSGVTRNPLSNTIRFGLVFDLDNGKEEK
ncbi:MAG TPA: type IX secretion system outer membrane channel protein PorV [Puia sp.]|nr:type IX secretion system outer membrane channel protein PorV [Puia sp.]